MTINTRTTSRLPAWSTVMPACFIATFLAIEAHSLHAQEPFGGRPRYTQPMPLSSVINGPGEGPDDLSISGDGLALYWTAVPNGKTRAQIWTATRASLDLEWDNAGPLGDGVNSGGRNMDADVTADGLEIYFRRSDVALNYNSTHRNDRLMVATRASAADPWNEATELPESINSPPCVNHPSVSGDGLELYFASTGTCRGQDADILVSKRSTRDDAWGEPQLVEPLAWTPAISSDGLRLYFMEGAREGAGLPEGARADGPNVFVRTRNSRDEEFGPAVELGNPPNTPGTQFAVWGPDESSDGDTLYFTSGRSGTPHGWGGWQTTPAELCDINGDGSCDVDDLSRSALFRVDLSEGSERESHIAKYDISGDGRVDANDLTTWLSEAAKTNGIESPYVRGDANLDGKFESDDLVAVFQAGKYELNTVASWSEGDWTGDRRFNSDDIVAAFQDGGYDAGARAAVSAVPEPTSAVLLLIGMTVICRVWQRR